MVESLVSSLFYTSRESLIQEAEGIKVMQPVRCLNLIRLKCTACIHLKIHIYGVQDLLCQQTLTQYHFVVFG
jgi:hypothetical protein